VLDPVEDRLAQVERARELVDGGRLAAREHERVHLGELRSPPDRSSHDVALGEGCEMLAHVPLEREHADDGLLMSGHVVPN
jgi:hypothetical protein